MGSNSSLGEAVLDLVADGSQMLNDIDKTKPSILSALNGLGKIGGAVLGTALAGAAAIGGFLFSSIGPASDLSETISKTNTIFGDSAAEILAWSETSATALGQSQQQALDAVAGFGTFGKAAGLAGDDLVAFVEENATLAGDLASFWNTSSEEAQAAIQAAFRGETEPIRKYGVMLDDASLRQKALEMGIIKTTKDALTPQQKTLAVNALLWEQTTDAQGDFERTSDGLANKQRILAAQFEDIRANLGTALLPAVQAVASAFGDWLSNPATQQFLQGAALALEDFANFVIDNIPIVIENFKAFGEWLSQNQGVIVAVLAIMGAAILAFLYSTATAAIAAAGGMAVLWASIWPVIAVLALIGLAAYLLYEAWTNNWGGIQEIVAGFWAWLQPMLQQLWNWLAINVPLALATMASFWQNTLLPAIMAFWAWLQPMLQQMWDWLAVNVPAALTTLAGFWQTVLLPAIMAVWAWISAYLFPLFMALADFWSTVFNVALTIMAGIWQNLLLPALTEVGSWLKDTVMPLFKTFGNFLSTSLSPAIETLAGFLSGALKAGFDGINRMIEGMIKLVKDLTKALGGLRPPPKFDPNSPTPFEMGLWGINDAMSALSGIELPKLTSELSGLTAPNAALAADGAGAMAGGTIINMYATVADGMDVMAMAHRVAEEISRRS